MNVPHRSGVCVLSSGPLAKEGVPVGGLGAALGVGHLPGDALPQSLFLCGVVRVVLLR